MEPRVIGAITSFLILAVWSLQNDVIRIEHVGPEDRPIPALRISTARIDVPSTESLVVVTKETLQLIVQEPMSSTLKNSAAPRRPEFGAFRITVDDGEPFYLTTRSNSIRFFKHLLDVTHEKDRGGQLDNHLSYLLSRIE